MKTKNIILIAIAILVIALVALGIYSFTSTGDLNILNATNDSDNGTDFIDIGTINANDTNETNATVIGDNSPRDNSTETGNNTTYKVYNPQSDSYVPVIGEKYDDEVNRWYTYDEDGVRYYNTRIN